MTRVTQAMLNTNMLRNLNNSYSKMSKYQDMINSGMKITRASDDPVVAIKGMKYRTEIDKLQQFKRNMNEAAAWLDTTDVALDQVGNVLNRVKELVVQAANGTNTIDDRRKIKEEIDQIHKQMQDVGNTQLNGKFIFSGTKTQTPTFIGDADNRIINPDINSNDVRIEVFDGIQLTVNTADARTLFSKVDDVLKNISADLDNSLTNEKEISEFLGGIADGSNATIADIHALVLNARADIGARMNRVDLMTERLDVHEINVTKQMSLNEDTDYAKTISDMTAQESIHQAALSVGAKIIQQTLVDFIR